MDKNYPTFFEILRGRYLDYLRKRESCKNAKKLAEMFGIDEKELKEKYKGKDVLKDMEGMFDKYGESKEDESR